MATVCFAWEIGEGLGHLKKIQILGQGLEARGHRIVVIAKALRSVRPILPAHWPVFQAPIHRDAPGEQGGRRQTPTYAHILAKIGYRSPESLRPLVDGWTTLFEVIRPDLVICETSPTAGLAARGRWPVVHVSNGHTLPPDHSPYFKTLVTGVEWRQGHDRVCKAVQEVLRDTDRPAISALPEIFSGELRIIDTLPEIDRYHEIRRDPLVGVLEELPEPSSSRMLKQVFAYLTPAYTQMEPLCEAIAWHADRMSVYFSGGTCPVGTFLRTRGATVHDAPQPFTQIMPASRVILSHATMQTTLSALAAGRPHIMLPRHQEAETTAAIAEDLGVGCRLTEISPAGLQSAIEHVCGHVADDRIMGLAEDIYDRRYGEFKHRCVDAIEELVV